MRRGKVRADRSPSTPDDKSTGSPVFVDDSGRRLFRTRAAAWSGTTTALFFLGSIGVAVLTGSLGGPSDWSRPFAPSQASSPSPSSGPGTPGSPGTAEAVIILPQHPTTGPPTTAPPAPTPSLPTTAAPTPTSAPPTTVPPTPSPTAPATVPAGKASHKPTAPPGKPTAKATGKPTAPPGKP
ncbi:MAG TPA: hypothetical protein VGK53_24220 [Propionicimonas sp.]